MESQARSAIIGCAAGQRPSIKQSSTHTEEHDVMQESCFSLYGRIAVTPERIQGGVCPINDDYVYGGFSLVQRLVETRSIIELQKLLLFFLHYLQTGPFKSVCYCETFFPKNRFPVPK